MPSGDGEIRRPADWFLHAVRVGNDTLLITLLFARRTVSPPIEPRLRSAEIERGGIEIEAKLSKEALGRNVNAELQLRRFDLTLRKVST